MIKTRNDWRRRAQRTGDPWTRSEVGILDRIIKEKINMLREKHRNNTLRGLKTGSKAYWKLVKAIRGPPRGVPHLKLSGNLIMSSDDKANILADVFKAAHQQTATSQRTDEQTIL